MNCQVVHGVSKQMDACMCRGPVARAFDLHQAVRPQVLFSAFVMVHRLSQGRFLCRMPQGAGRQSLAQPRDFTWLETLHIRIFPRLLWFHARHMFCTLVAHRLVHHFSLGDAAGL